MQSNRMQSYRRMVKQAAAVVLAVSLTAGCSMLPSEEEALAPPLVKPKEEAFDVVEVARGNIQTYLKGMATFTSSKTEPLFFKESGGRIKTVALKVGEMVEAGQTVIELDVGDLELRARLQRLSVERAEILFGQAVREGLTGNELRLREIDLDRERISLEALESQLSRSKLVSPIAGKITYLADLKPGDSVTGYQPIVTVADPYQVLLSYQAPSDADLYPVHANMEVKVTYDKQEYRGTVLQSPSSAPLTLDKSEADRNAKLLIIGLVDPIEGVEIGDRADFEIALEKRENVIVIPRSGLRNYLGRTYVQVAEGERRKEVDVEVGLRTSIEVEITRGLEEGAQIIMNN